MPITDQDDCAICQVNFWDQFAASPETVEDGALRLRERYNQITVANIIPGDLVLQTACNHYFHRSCVENAMRAMAGMPTCPLCRGNPWQPGYQMNEVTGLEFGRYLDHQNDVQDANDQMFR